MATNKQRREAERRRLQQQLAERRAKEVARRRFTLISSIVGTLAVVALIVIVIVATTGGGDSKKKNDAQSRPTGATSAAPSPTATGNACNNQLPASTVRAAKGASVSFDGVTVKGATDLGGKPEVSAKGATDPAKVEVKDLVVGKGAAASPSSCVDVQYVGVLYKNGTEFDSSWKNGSAAEFSLTRVVAGFTTGIGGGSGVAPMKVGGRRIMIIPSALGYGPSGSPPTIPANAPLVFVVDLLKVS